jgi:murein DD-endopeptidase MepM/ murein hydrolase activator NlpD
MGALKTERLSTAQMSKCHGKQVRHRRTAALVVLLTVVGCTDPARVVLFEERRHVERPLAQLAFPKPPPLPMQRVEARKPTRNKPATVHTVRSGETVYTIALRHQVPIRGLIALNGLQAPYVLQSGRVLLMPKRRRHVVRPGDTIYGISRTYEVALSRLVQLNGIAPPYKIVVGHILRLPDSVEQQPAVVAKPSSRPQTAKVAPPAKKRGNIKAASKKAQGPKVRPKPKPRKALAAIPKPPPLSNRKFLLPVRGRLLSRFGPKGRGLRNDGVNIAAPRGSPVRAAQNGIVVYSGNALLGFGNMLLVRHANGYMTAYAHNESISVKRGDTVRRGQVISTVGSSGNVASPQLHFEIRKGKRAVNPAKYLPKLSSSA